MKKVHLYVIVLLFALSAGKLLGRIAPGHTHAGPEKERYSIAAGNPDISIHAQETARQLFAESKIQDNYPGFRQYSASYKTSSRYRFLASIAQTDRHSAYEMVFPGIHRPPIYLSCSKMVI